MAKYVAVVTGINSTELVSDNSEERVRTRLNTLRYAEADARELEVVLNNAGYDVALLLGPKATREAIIEAIEQKYEIINREEDVFLFYFAGHGAVDHRGRAYLLPFGSDPSRLASTCLPMESLPRMYLAGLLQAVIILDCCHSGHVAGVLGDSDDAIRGQAKLFRQRISANFKRVYGRVLLAACAGNQKAWELPRLKHGAFTYYVLKCWKDNRHRDLSISLLHDTIAQGLKSRGLAPPVRGGLEVGSLILRSAQEYPRRINNLHQLPEPTRIPNRIVKQRERVYALLIALDETHWQALLIDLGTPPLVSVGGRPAQIRNLIREWDNEGLLKALEDAAQSQAVQQAEAPPVSSV